ncbi:MAG: hypothetical protein R3250_15835 [Melioribacteraceae bacterium]|nr:hypothetical protein [Melioribacteraceae bacterium]
MKLKIGDVVLFRGARKSIVSRMISKVTNSQFSHVGIIYSLKSDGSICIAEALWEGFVINHYSKEEMYFLFPRLQIKRTNILLGQEKIQNEIIKYKGISYGFSQLFAIWIHRITGKEIIKNGLQDLICSEVVARVLYDCSGGTINFEKEFGIPFDYISPAQIARSTQLELIYDGIELVGGVKK